MEVPHERSSYMREPSPSGISDVSDSSMEETMETGLKAKPRGRIVKGWKGFLTTFMSPQPSSQTTVAFERWKGRGRKPMNTLLVLLVTATVAVIILVVLLIYYTIHLNSQIPRNDIQRMIASWGKPGTPTSSLAQYPTDFSQGITPIPCHSHNDYDRRVPLYDALAAGCTSVEADLWYSPRSLLVGHTLQSLTEARTLRSLYVDPLISILSHQNPSSQPDVNATGSLHGLFDSSPETPLVLLLDIKTDPAKTLNAASEALEPLRSRGWLTYFDGSKVTQRLITVVASGDAPFDLITSNSTYRDVFYDAPLADLFGENIPTNHTLYTAENSYYASTNFEASIGKPWHSILTPKQVDMVRGQVAEAEKRGLKARYWNTPSWPRRNKEHVWDVLEREGAGMLSTDDLDGISQRRWLGH